VIDLNGDPEMTAAMENTRLRKTNEILRQALADCDREARNYMAATEGENGTAGVIGLLIGIMTGAPFGAAAMWYWVG
jgi:hypothetical protein